MKKVLTFIIIFTILFIPIFNKTGYYIYAENSLIQQGEKEKNYLNELEIIQKQIYVLSSNVLKSTIDKSDETHKRQLLKDVEFINAQIKHLRVELQAYHQTKLGDIEKNPLSLALLNSLNYSSMSLSYLACLITEESISDKNECFQGYYFSKYQSDQTLSWLKTQIK